MPLRGISETIVNVYNPMPEITEAEIGKRAELSLMEFSERRTPFDWHWRYDSGLNEEHIDVSPGKSFPLRKSEADLFLRQFREQGAVLLDDLSDEEQLLKASLKGLRTAQKFWNDRGSKRIVEYRKVHGISREDLDDFQYDLWRYHFNQAIADAIGERIIELTSPPKRAKKAASK